MYATPNPWSNTMKTKRFIEEIHTFCDGWTCAGTFSDGEDEYPASYDTLKEATDEVEDFFKGIQYEIDTGERSIDEGYDEDDFRIVDTKTREIYIFSFVNKLLCISSGGKVEPEHLDRNISR